MLLRFKIKNFLSFYEETSFDMFPNTKRTTFNNHIYEQLKVPLLKQAAIYGPNGSGKSNFIKAIDFLKHFILDEDFLKKIDFNDFTFQLVQKKQSKITFEIEFYIKGKFFLYKVEMEKNNIAESLHLSGIGLSDNKLLYSRNGSKIDSQYLSNEESATKLLKMNTSSCLLPLNQKFPVINNEDVKLAFEWFHNNLEIVTINSQVPALIEMMHKQKRLLEMTNSILKNIDIGVNSLSVEDTPFDEWVKTKKNTDELQQIINKEPFRPNTGISRMENNRNIFSVSMKKGIKTVQEFLFEQIGQSGYKNNMKITAQSDGTVRLLTLIPAIYDAIYKEKVIFIDEIDNSIHPNLIFSLLKYYGKAESKGQLVFTTHSTSLIDQQELLRPDEIWLTEKEQGNTRMYSINEFKIHNTINLEKGYLDGRFGAIPNIREFNSN